MGLAAASQKSQPAIGDIQPLHRSTAPPLERPRRARTDSLRAVIWLTRAREYHNRCGYASVKPERARYCEADTTRRRLVAETRRASLDLAARSSTSRDVAREAFAKCLERQFELELIGASDGDRMPPRL
jgi:hypothetical protein